jgi:hypothetical protein
MVRATRRIVLGGIGCTVAGVSDPCFANFWHMASSWEPWKKIPSIVVTSAKNDTRLAAVYDAVAFWNATLRNVGSSFRLGPVTRNVDAALYDDLRKYSDPGSLGDLLAYSSADAFGLNDTIAAVPEDIVVLLSDRASYPFARKLPGIRKVLIVITKKVPDPFIRQQTAHNVIAHELGHAIGLGHNGEPESLMCGGNTTCDIDDPIDEFLPLTRSDRVKLLAMYPPGWQPEAVK